MKNVGIPTLGEPPVFTKLEAHDAYWVESTSWDWRKLFYEMNLSGFSVSQPETSDVDTIVSWVASVHSALSDFIDAFKEWLELGGTYPTEPSLPSLPANYDFFYRDVLQAVSGFYDVLKKCREKQIDQIFVTQIVESEGIINIGDHMVWMKSVSVDAI